MKVIFNNDDYGLTYGFSSAIKDAYLKGPTRSTSIRINGTNTLKAISLFNGKLKNLGRGLHLNLTDGKCFVKELGNRQGEYRHNFLTYYLLLLFGSEKIKNLIIKEFELQYKVLTKNKVQIDHVDGQDHIHMVPQIFEIVCKFCQKHKIKAIRLVRESFYLPKGVLPNPLSLIKFSILNIFAKVNESTLKKYNLLTTDACYGVLYTNGMDIKVIKAIIADAARRSYKSIEILSHPAYIYQKSDIVYTSKFTSEYANLPNRLVEAKALRSKTLKKYLDKKTLELASFADLG